MNKKILLSLITRWYKKLQTQRLYKRNEVCKEMRTTINKLQLAIAKEKLIKGEINKMVTDLEYVNNITKYLDTLLLPGYKKAHEQIGVSTYVEKYSEDKYIIRFPGATRGHILVDDDNIIKYIEIYDHIQCYEKDTNKKIQDFVGTKLELKNKYE